MDMVIITQTFTIARWQIVVKRSEATKQIKDQNKNNKQTIKQELPFIFLDFPVCCTVVGSAALLTFLHKLLTPP